MFTDSLIINLTKKNFGFDRITHKNFSSRVGDKFGIVVFFMPGCPWCHRMKNEYIEAAKFCRGIIPFGAIDGSLKENAEIIVRYKVTKFPTIRLVDNGFIFTEFTSSDRTKKDFINFICNNIPDKKIINC